MTTDDGLNDVSPLGEPALLILIALSGGPRHGYAITQDIESFAGIRLGPGTLYAALGRLEARGLIEALPPHDRRRPYRLTGRGGHVLSSRLQGLTDLATLGLRRLERST